MSSSEEGSYLISLFLEPRTQRAYRGRSSDALEAQGLSPRDCESGGQERRERVAGTPAMEGGALDRKGGEADTSALCPRPCVPGYGTWAVGRHTQHRAGHDGAVGDVCHGPQNPRRPNSVG